MLAYSSRLAAAAASLAIALAAFPAAAQEGAPAGTETPATDGGHLIAAAGLDGFQEVPAAIFTDGVGSVRLFQEEDAIRYELRYSNLTGDITASVGVHIHFGRPGVNGGIAAFLCEGAGLAAPIGTPLCVDDGTGSGVVTGTIRDADVLGLAAQGFPGGDLDDLIRIIKARAAYVNLHTDEFGSGEIRGAIIPSRRR